MAIGSEGKIKAGDARFVPIQIIFCMKEKNQKKVRAPQCTCTEMLTIGRSTVTGGSSSESAKQDMSSTLTMTVLSELV